MNFEEKVAIITGGTAGIGEAAARRMADLGAKVVIAGRDQHRGEGIEKELLSRGLQVAFFKADLALPDDARSIVPFTIDTFGRLDYAFNNAGTSGRNGFILDQSEENFDAVFAVNVKGLFLTMQQEVRQMVHQGWGGSIVNMASLGASVVTPGAAPYNASKHAVIGLTKSAAVEYGPHGIRVNAISPGAIRTEMLRKVFGDDSVLDEMAQVHPIGRIGYAEEVADAVAWLLSEQSSYYTGQSLVLDGGLSARRPFVRAAAPENAEDVVAA